MSKQEARKITIIEELLAGRFTNKQAAVLLDLSVRQVQRMKAEASKNGVMSILHKNRGRKPANALASEVAEAIVSIYQTELSGYNFCHATDVLAEKKASLYLSVLFQDILKKGEFALQKPSAGLKSTVPEMPENVKGKWLRWMLPSLIGLIMVLTCICMVPLTMQLAAFWPCTLTRRKPWKATVN